jgi:hypothetical protein
MTDVAHVRFIAVRKLDFQAGKHSLQCNGTNQILKIFEAI